MLKRQVRHLPTPSSTARVALFALLVWGCDSRGTGSASVHNACLAVGLCDKPRAEAVTLDILCDASRGSSCDRTTALAVIDEALRGLGDRSGSTLRLWSMGATGAETRTVATIVVPSVTGSVRAQRNQIERWAASTRAALSLALEPTFAATPARRSPIAESIAKVALASARSPHRRVIVVGDARESSGLGDFECGSLDARSFRRALARRRILGEASASGIGFDFAFMTAGPVASRGCTVSMGRETAVRELWRSSLTSAGAASVRFHSDAPGIDFAPPTTPANPRSVP